MKFLYRLIKHTALWLISISLQLVGAIVLIPLSWLYDVGKLPRVFRWFDGADPFVGRDTSVIDDINAGRINPYTLFPIPESRIQLAVNKYIWLAWRNPLNYYGYKIEGFQVESTPIPIIDNPKIGHGVGDTGGYMELEAEIDGKIRYEYYIIIPYKAPMIGIKALRFRLGYKLGTIAENKPGEYVQQVFTINPFASYSGIL